MNTIVRAGVTILVILSSGQLLCASVFNTNLSLGARSNDVKTVQQFLISQGLLTGTSTGYFGDQTKKAVQAFQKKHSLPATGVWFVLTRQKAELTVGNIGTVNSNNISNSNLKKDAIMNTKINKELTLTISNTSGGSVFSTENNIACYASQTCLKVFPADKKITLKAIPVEGYVFDGWSEASCGTNLECSVSLVENTTVSARFKVPFYKRVGKIVYPTVSDVCYIGLGQETCNLPVYWVNDTGLDMSLKVDGKEYVINVENPSSSNVKYPVNPHIFLKNEPKNAVGPIFFPLTAGKQYVELRSAGQLLDTASVEVQCEQGLYLQYHRICWQDGAKKVVTFKQEGILVKSDIRGVTCGYQYGNCFAAFPYAVTVTFTAVALPGHSFKRWTGDCSGTLPVCTLIMDKDKVIGTE